MPFVPSRRRTLVARSLGCGAALAVALGLAACTEDKNNPSRSAAPTNGAAAKASGVPVERDSRQVGGYGQPVAQGMFESLAVSPDGRFGAYLADPEKPRVEGANPLIRLGELNLAKLEPGAGARRMGTAVSNLPGGFVFSPDSHYLVFLSGYSLATREGTLGVIDLRDEKATPTQVGKAVTFYSVSPDGKWLAAVDGGVLKIGALGSGPMADVSGEVSTAEFSQDSSSVVFQRKVSAAAGLFHVSSAKWTELHKIADGVSNYAVASDARHVAYTQQAPGKSTTDLFVSELPKPKPVRVAVAVGPFAFSPDGKWLARVESKAYEKRADLVVGTLRVGPADGTGGTEVSARGIDKPGAFTFAPDSKALAFYEPPTRKIGKTDAWQLGVVTLPGGKPKILADQVPNYRWGADSSLLAFVEHIFKPIYTVDGFLYRAGEDAPTRYYPGVFGYSFAPGNASLVFRSECTNLPKGCDLLAIDPKKADDKPKKVLDKIFDYRFSEDGNRILVTYARIELGEYYDAAVFNQKSGVRKTLDQKILWPPYLLGKDGAKVAYLIGDKQRAGLYVATDVP